MRSWITLLALLLAPAAVAQDGGSWVSLGSFGASDAAERARSTAAERLSDPVRVSMTETAGGVRYRVVAGPFASRQAALARMPDIQGSGYADAWIVQGGGMSVAAPVVGTSVANASSTVGTAGAAEATSLDEYGLDDYDLDDLDLDDLDLDAELPITDLLGLEGLDLPDLDLGDVPALTAPVERDPTIKPTEEPVFEAPPNYQLHKLKRGA